MKRIDTLTDTMRAEMAPHVAEWIARGLDCTPVDRAAVEDGMRRCYEYAGIPWHGNVIWVGSPLTVAHAGPIAAALLDKDAVADVVGGAVNRAVSGAVNGAVSDAVGDAVGGAVNGAVNVAVYGAVSGAVGGAVFDAVDGAVDRAVSGAVVKDGWRRYIGGQWWAGWLAWRTYFRRVGLELEGDIWDRCTAYEDANQAGWWWPHRQFIIVAERPLHVHRERVGPDGWGSHRMHCATGPAIAWRDGWALWFWHGRNVPAWVIDDPTPERIAAERNIEIRRCAIESLGWDRYLDAINATPVASDRDENGNPRHLYIANFPTTRNGGGPLGVCVVTNGTPERDGTVRRYGITVPATITTPLEAVAWSYDLDATEYAQLSTRT